MQGRRGSESQPLTENEWEVIPVATKKSMFSFRFTFTHFEKAHGTVVNELGTTGGMYNGTD